MLSLAKACFRPTDEHAFATERKHGTRKNNIDAPLEVRRGRQRRAGRMAEQGAA